MCLIPYILENVLKCIFFAVNKTAISLIYPIACLFPSLFVLKLLGFLGGFLLGVLYYYFLLAKIPFSPLAHLLFATAISLTLSVGNAVCRQLRCITFLTIPMYCGKPGRGVLKALVLTYVIAGPIKNMCLNAREVVRVFACSTQLSYNLSKTKYGMLREPFKEVLGDLKDDMDEVVDAFRSFGEVASSIAKEFVDENELNVSRKINLAIDFLLGGENRSAAVDFKYKVFEKDDRNQKYQKWYLRKLEYRCHQMLSRGVFNCLQIFKDTYERCMEEIPSGASALCFPLKTTRICNLLGRAREVCDSTDHVDSGAGEGFLSLEKSWRELSKDVVAERLNRTQLLEDIQDAKETAERVMHAFDEKEMVMTTVIHIVNIFVALLFLRIIIAAAGYHDSYLTKIDFDNFYITDYFKELDNRRKRRGDITLLPLKKMERMKYVDVRSREYNVDCDKLVVQILKVLLEMITATTFVMLDRLFYEALDVVRQHAEMAAPEDMAQDMTIDIKGTGLLSKIMGKVVYGLKNTTRRRRAVSNRPCLPQPRLMPATFFLKIYGGYLGVQLLLYLNPYTIRLSRLICSYFYPRREKQRVLHLYNDILKKRLKLQKTLRRKAVQFVRAYYLSGENLLNLRMTFPQLFGWLKIFPAARMDCLICGQTEPRNPPQEASKVWHVCYSAKCPFIYCPECWEDIGRKCLACDPGLAELSDVDSLSDDDRIRY